MIELLDLPTDIIHNNIASYLLKDKQINKIFYKNDDDELKYLLFGKDIELPYIEPYSWNEYIEEADIYLDTLINYINTNHNLNCDSWEIKYRVNRDLSYYASIINLYNNDKKIGRVSLHSYSLFKINDEDNHILIRNKECLYIIVRLMKNIKQYIFNYRNNY